MLKITLQTKLARTPQPSIVKTIEDELETERYRKEERKKRHISPAPKAEKVGRELDGEPRAWSPALTDRANARA